MFRSIPRFKRPILAAATTTLVGGAAAVALSPLLLDSAPPSAQAYERPGPLWSPPSRAQMIAQLKKSGKGIKIPQFAEKEDDEYDLLIVGGGATGAGSALDAATRGLKVALVERDDFSSGACRFPFSLADRRAVEDRARGARGATGRRPLQMAALPPTG